jgi:hypothetical protein
MSRRFSGGPAVSRHRFLSSAALIGGGLAMPRRLAGCGDTTTSATGPIELPAAAA